MEHSFTPIRDASFNAPVSIAPVAHRTTQVFSDVATALNSLALSLGYEKQNPRDGNLSSRLKANVEITKIIDTLDRLLAEMDGPNGEIKKKRKSIMRTHYGEYSTKNPSWERDVDMILDGIRNDTSAAIRAAKKCRTGHADRINDEGVYYIVENAIITLEKAAKRISNFGTEMFQAERKHQMDRVI